MTSSNILEKIKQWSSEGNIRYKKHAFIRIVERKIKVAEVEEALQHAEIVKRYTEDTPLDSMLLLGYTNEKRPLHIVAALDENHSLIWIITVYEPDAEKWDQSLTKRR